MTTTKLFDRITTCSLAFQHARADGGEDHRSSYRRVMESLPRTKPMNANLTKAAMSFICTGFPERDTSDRKVEIAMCVATSIAEGRDEEDRLVKAICDRFRVLDDFDRHVMEKIFSLSLCSDSVLTLLDNIMILKKKKGVVRDVQRELQAEFILMFFDTLASVLKRETSVGVLGYVTGATPSNMRNARTTLEKHVSLIADKYGACFKLRAFKVAQPTLTIGCKHIDFDEATIDTLKECLVDDMKARGDFLDIMFAIISLSYKTPCETYAGMKLDAAKSFFLGDILDKRDADHVVKTMCKTPQEIHLRERVVSLKKQLRRANKETMRMKAAHDDGKEAFLRNEIGRVKEICEDQRQQLSTANTNISRLESRVKSGVGEVEMWKKISHTPKEARLNDEIAALKKKWDESRREAENLRSMDAEQKNHLERVITLNETLEKKAVDMERRAKQASRAFCTRWGYPNVDLEDKKLCEKKKRPFHVVDGRRKKNKWCDVVG